MRVYERDTETWCLRSRTLELGRRTLVMGVVNITPDSFSDGGAFLDPEAAIAHALQLLDEGADVVDLGAESTRPGSHAGNGADFRQAADVSAGAAESAETAVSADEEQARLLPVLDGILRARPDALISVDTYKAATARAALAAGAEIVNDVSGFGWDTKIASVCAEFKCGVVLMHTRGRPDEWRAQPQLAPDALLAMVRAGLAASLAAATEAGIPAESVVLDPGYGFGKRFDENYALLARQAELLSLGRPLMAGVSRKSFLGWTLAAADGGKPAGASAAVSAGAPAGVMERETASLAAMVAAIFHGTSIVRVHAVRPAVEAARIADAILAARPAETSDLFLDGG